MPYPHITAALAFYAAPLGYYTNPPSIVQAAQMRSVTLLLELDPLTPAALAVAEKWLAVPANFAVYVTVVHAQPDYWGGEHQDWAESIATLLSVYDHYR